MAGVEANANIDLKEHHCEADNFRYKNPESTNLTMSDNHFVVQLLPGHYYAVGATTAEEGGPTWWSHPITEQEYKNAIRACKPNYDNIQELNDAIRGNTFPPSIDLETTAHLLTQQLQALQNPALQHNNDSWQP